MTFIVLRAAVLAFMQNCKSAKLTKKLNGTDDLRKWPKRAISREEHSSSSSLFSDSYELEHSKSKRTETYSLS